MTSLVFVVWENEFSIRCVPRFLICNMEMWDSCNTVSWGRQSTKRKLIRWILFLCAYGKLKSKFPAILFIALENESLNLCFFLYSFYCLIIHHANEKEGSEMTFIVFLKWTSQWTRLLLSCFISKPAPGVGIMTCIFQGEIRSYLTKIQSLTWEQITRTP